MFEEISYLQDRTKTEENVMFLWEMSKTKLLFVTKNAKICEIYF